MRDSRNNHDADRYVTTYQPKNRANMSKELVRHKLKMK